MNCANCGTQISDPNATFCPNCGAPLAASNVPPAGVTPSPAPSPYPPAGQYAPPAANVPNYMVPAILSTIFCCLPFGIVSIINASKVNSLVAAGDIAGAQQASANAKKWAIVAAVLGVIMVCIYAIVIVAQIMAASASYPY